MPRMFLRWVSRLSLGFWRGAACVVSVLALQTEGVSWSWRTALDFCARPFVRRSVPNLPLGISSRSWGMWTDGRTKRPDETMSRYLDPTNDVTFKKLFSNEARLKDFLNQVLAPKWGTIEKLDFISQEELPATHEGKRSLVDVKCRNEKGEIFIVEMQNRPEQAFLNRVQFYASQSLAAQMIKGGDHSQMMPVVLLALTGRSVFGPEIPCISYHWTVEQATGSHLLRSIAYVFIELPKFTKKRDACTTFQDEWLYFFSQWYRTKQPPNLKDPLVREAYDTIERCNWTAAQFDAYIKSRLLEEIETGNLAKSFQDGQIEGKAQGKAEADYERALQFVTDGTFTLEQAIEKFSLSDEMAERLREAHQK